MNRIKILVSAEIILDFADDTEATYVYDGEKFVIGKREMVIHLCKECGSNIPDKDKIQRVI